MKKYQFAARRTSHATWDIEAGSLEEAVAKYRKRREAPDRDDGVSDVELFRVSEEGDHRSRLQQALKIMGVLEVTDHAKHDKRLRTALERQAGNWPFAVTVHPWCVWADEDPDTENAFKVIIEDLGADVRYTLNPAEYGAMMDQLTEEEGGEQ